MILFDASRLPPGVGRPEAFSCLVLSLQTLSFTLGCRPLGCCTDLFFSRSTRAHDSQKLCESHEEAWIGLLDGFTPHLAAAKSSTLRRHTHTRICLVITDTQRLVNKTQRALAS